MNYIFVFLGEFGYELLNWQGVIRKFSKTIDKSKDKITICTRKGLEPFYEFADKYMDISGLSYFKNSAACMYWAHNPELNFYKYHNDVVEGRLPYDFLSKKNKKYQKKLKEQIKNYVFEKLNFDIWEKYFLKNYKFIFSSDYQTVNGLEFGTDSMTSARIYDDLNLNNNTFIKIEPCKDANKNIEQKLGFKLSEKYILCQTGSRPIIQRSKEHISVKILKELSKKIKVILLDFDTKRNYDSKSKFENIENCYKYSCTSFREQSVLISNAKACLFFTEGDFRSHNYIPPFMGKDVYSIAPKKVFELGNTPIDFWNKNVFQFGGKIIPIFSEDIEKMNAIKIFTELENV